MKNLLKLIAVFAMVIAINVNGYAQDEDLYPGGTYNSSITTPNDFLGYPFGTLHTFHADMVNYMDKLADQSDRVLTQVYGKTYQGRKLLNVIITSPENMAKLEEYRLANLKLTDPTVTSKEEAAKIAESLPAIVWLGYNIHGNEASGMEAAIRTAYQLTAGTDAETMNILKNVITIIDPVQNPDGRDRFNHYNRSIVTLDSHPQLMDREHSNPWPGGRTNHYLFDLNRDFFLKTQIESKKKAELYAKWMPHVFADLHEMGTNSTYFFAPPMDPYNEYVTEDLKKWWGMIAEGNAKAFDHFGWGYYTKESFDAFYPGYGTSYPAIKGSVGMTYEQASARGVSSMRADGTVLTLREGSWHHFTTSMATLKVSADNRQAKVNDFYKFFDDAIASVDNDPMKEIILVPGHDHHITAKLIDNMLIEKVKIKVAAKEFTKKKSYSYLTKQTTTKTFPAGSYIISLRQSAKVLIKTLLGNDAKLEDSFIEDERQRRADKERTHFYDISSWSMPLTYGIDAYWTSDESTVEANEITEVPKITGKLNGQPAKQAYLIPFETFQSTKMMYKLIQDGYKIRIANKPFTLDGKVWKRGTLVVRVNRNKEDIHTVIPKLAAEYGVDVYSLNSGLSAEGIDLGSGNIRPIVEPKIALLTEAPTASYSYGAFHYLFERIAEINFTRVSIDDLGRLDDFNILVMPDGRYNNALNENQAEAFKTWIRKGGTVVAVGGAVSFLVNEKISTIKSMTGTPDPKDKTKKIKIEYTPGAIVKVNMNQLSFLSYGVQESVPAFIRSANIYSSFEDKFKNIGVYAKADEVKLSGWIWPETEQYLEGNGYLFLERFGRGKAVIFAEDPTFRASYEGLNKLFFNAIILGPSFNQ